MLLKQIRESIVAALDYLLFQIQFWALSQADLIEPLIENDAQVAGGKSLHLFPCALEMATLALCSFCGLISFGFHVV